MHPFLISHFSVDLSIRSGVPTHCPCCSSYLLLRPCWTPNDHLILSRLRNITISRESLSGLRLPPATPPWPRYKLWCEILLYMGISADILQIHMAEYLELSDWESSGSEFAWLVLGHAVRLGHSVGIAQQWWLETTSDNMNCRLDCVSSHLIFMVMRRCELSVDLDSARWKLSEDITQRRSRVFWQLLEMDTWTVSQGCLSSATSISRLD